MQAPRDDEAARRGEEARVVYRVWVRSRVLRDEVFDDRNGAELFRLKPEASCPGLRPADVVVLPEQPGAGGGGPTAGATV